MSAPLPRTWSALLVGLALAASAGAEPAGYDPLPPGALQRLGTLQFRPHGGISNFFPYYYPVAIAPNGKVLVLCGSTSPVRLLDVSTGRQLHQLTSSCQALTFDPQGTVLAGEGVTAFYVWDLATRRLLGQINEPDRSPNRETGPGRRYPSAQGKCLSFSLSAGGKHLAALYRSTDGAALAYIWEVATGKQRACIQLPTWLGSHMALSPDGQLLATTTRPRVYSPPLGPRPPVTPLPPSPVPERGGAEMPPKPPTPASPNRGSGREEAKASVVVWDVATGKEKYRLDCEGVKDWQGLAFAPDGRLLAATTWSKGLAVLWDVATGQEKRRFLTRSDVGRVIQFAPDGRRLAIAGLGAVQVWDVATGKYLGQSDRLPDSLPSLAFPADGRVLAAAPKTVTVLIQDVLADRLLTPTRGHVGSILGLSFSADGQVLTSLDGYGMVCRWNSATGQLIGQLLLPGRGAPYISAWERFKTAVFAPDQRHVLATEGMSGVHLFELPRGCEVASFKDLSPHFGHLTSLVVLSPDGTRLAVPLVAGLPGAQVPQTHFAVYEVASGKEVGRTRSQPLYVTCLALAPNGTSLAVGTGDRYGGIIGQNVGVRLLDTATGQEIWQNTKVRSMPTAVTFTPDGKAVVLQDPTGSLTFLFTSSGEEFRRLEGKTTSPGFTPPRRVSPVTPPLRFSPDGRTFATVQSGPNQETQVAVWEMVSGTLRHQFAGHLGALSALAFTPDSRRLATGGGDTTILVWDLIRGTEAPSRRDRPSADEWDKIWAQLGAPESRAAHQAMCRMLDAPETAVGFLKSHLPDPKVLAQLIAGLDKDDPQERDKAMHQLEDLGLPISEVLRKALADNPTPEVRRRLERILAREDPHEPTRRMTRALEVLQWIDTPEARGFLHSLAQQYPNTALGQAARETFDHLARQASEKRP